MILSRLYDFRSCRLLSSCAVRFLASLSRHGRAKNVPIQSCFSHLARLSIPARLRIFIPFRFDIILAVRTTNALFVYMIFRIFAIISPKSFSIAWCLHLMKWKDLSSGIPYKGDQSSSSWLLILSLLPDRSQWYVYLMANI